MFPLLSFGFRFTLDRVVLGSRQGRAANSLARKGSNAMSAPVSANRFSATLSSGAPDACNYEEIRDRLVQAVVEAHRAADPECQVVCRVYAGVGKVIVTGETTAEVAVDVEEVAREALRETPQKKDPDWGVQYWPEYFI